MYCSSCGAKVSASGRFCSFCGQSIDLNNAATLEGNEVSPEPETIASHPTTPKPSSMPPSPRPGRTPTGAGGILTSSDPIGGGRFTPGLMIAERYRIVALLGRGGMGEVYRAEDLKLSQVVAIKFLPESLSQDPSVLARFHTEVRLARQVSHPNVCRVFDIGDAEGIPFLTMEYVDGEDLASLVRRIGRLSPDKATEIARQVCAGLAAAHERGVIHRDLKPANVMLDGAGKVRITDFGLAGLAANVNGGDVRAGTPAYMAPEQLAGKEVTTKSDLYSLGLVLYEILTGKRAFEASSLPELMKLREHGALANPSTLVRDLDPLLEKAILRCLERDPSQRPAAALQVAASLPGGDPLAAALAAGETPSPKMVAAAGETFGLSPRQAIACLAAVVLGTILFSYLGIKENGLEKLHTPNSPEVLDQKAREIVARFGYPDPPKDRAMGMAYDLDYLDYVGKNDKPHPAWERILRERPQLLVYWYRQSPADMSPDGYTGVSLTPGVVTFSDPPAILSGMVNLKLDPEGRLTYFQAIPPEKLDHPQPSQALDWSLLFSAAGLDPASLRPAESTWAALAATDVRAAWDGVWPGSARPLHVEAGAWHGKPVFFSLIGPWTQAKRMGPPVRTKGEKAASTIAFSITVLLLLVGVFLAHRNYTKGRGDRAGASKLALAVFILEMTVFLFRAHLAFTLDAFFLFLLAVGTALLVSGIMWMLYLALEPYVRRHWPQTIISWSRVLEGRYRDPLVARDVLSGLILGTIWVLVFKVGFYFTMRAGAQPQFGSSDFLLGARETIATWLGTGVTSILTTLNFFFLLVLLRVLVRNRWLAAALFVVVFSVPRVLGSNYWVVDSLVLAVAYTIAAIAVVRFGVIVLAVGILMADVLFNVHYTLDFSNWFALNSLGVLLSFLVVAGWAFYASLGGQRLWKEGLFD